MTNGIHSIDISGGLVLPNGNNTTDRPTASTSLNGLMRYNTVSNSVELIVSGAYTSIVTGYTSVADKTVLSNISGVTAAPSANTLTAVIDSTIGSTQGDILYRGASSWSVLAPGTSGQVLQTQGAAANPSWATVTGTGTVTSVATGSGLTGGPFSTSGTVSVVTNGITAGLFRQSVANSLVGNATGSLANVTDITLGTTLSFVSTVLETAAMTGDVTASANSFSTTVAKIAGVSVGTPTGTGNVVFSASPTLTGTVSGAAATWSGLTQTATLGVATGTVPSGYVAKINGNIQAAGSILATSTGPASDSTDGIKLLYSSGSGYLAVGASDAVVIGNGNLTVGGIPSTTLATFGASGNLNITSGTYQIGGTQITASNLSNGTTGSGAVVLATSPQLGNTGIGAAASGTYALNVVQSGSNQAYFGSTSSNDSQVTINNASGSNQSILQLALGGSVKWQVGMTSSGAFYVYDPVGAKTFIQATTGSSLSLGAAQNFSIDQSGNATTLTQSAGNNTTRIATTAFVTTAISSIPLSQFPRYTVWYDFTSASRTSTSPFTKSAQSAIPSFGDITFYSEYSDEVTQSRWYQMVLYASTPTVATQYLGSVDDHAFIYLNGTLIASSGTDSVNNLTITYNFISGNNTIDIIYNNSGGVGNLVLVGDFFFTYPTLSFVSG